MEAERLNATKDDLRTIHRVEISSPKEIGRQ
jgi:hypothetical protein